MKLLDVFHGFDGRIGRLKWWLATGFLSALAFALYSTLSLFILPPLPNTAEQLSLLRDPQVQLSNAHRGAWFTFGMTAFFLYPMLCVTAKRLNDRARPDWWKWVAVAPFVIGPVLAVMGFGWEVGDVGNGVMMARPTMLASFFGLLASCVAFALLVDCGFLPTAKGIEDMKPNRDALNDRAALKERRSRAVLTEEAAPQASHQ